MNLSSAISGSAAPASAASLRPSRPAAKSSWKYLKPQSIRLAKQAQKALRIARVHAASTLRALPVVRDSLHLPRNDVHPVRSSPGEGVRIRVVSPEDTFVRALPFMPGEAETHDLFVREQRGRTHATFVAELHRGRLWTFYGGSVFTREGRLIPSLSKDVWGPRLHSAFARTRLPKPEWLPGRTLSLITPEAAGNYHHWMMDLLPRIGMLQRAGYSLSEFDRVLLKCRGLPFQKETLRRAGLDERKIVLVGDNQHLEAETLIVPALHMEDMRVNADDTRFVRQLFLPEEPAPGAAWRRLYVGRSDAAYRRVINKPDIRPILDRYGFEEVTMSKLTVEEGARLFSEAAIVAGPNGSALANVLFAHPDCRVIEFFAPGWVVPYNWMIGANLGLSYTVLIGRGNRPAPGSLPRELRQDIDLVPEQLEIAIAEAVREQTAQRPFFG